MTRLDIGKCVDRGKTRVLSKRKGDSIESGSERSHGILLDARDLA